jgi:PAS domain S-box-containing protein
MSENRLNTVDRNTHAIDRRQQSSINYHNDRRHQQDDRRRHYSDECHHQQLLEICLIELNQAKDRYHQLFNLSPIAYIFISSDGQISDLNTSAASLLGGERQTLIHQSFSHFVSQEETERWQKLWLKIQHNEVSMPVDLSLTPLKGKPFLARVENLGKLNKVLNNLLAISDISQNQKKINFPDLTALTFNIQEGLMLTNAELIIQQVNPAFSRITGYDSNEVLGQSPRFLSSGLQDIGFYQTMWDSINHQGYWQGELCNRRKNGEIFPEWLTITSFLDSNGQMFYIGSFIDISNYKQKEKQTLARHQQQELQYQSELQQKNIELQQIKSELNEINTALKVLVKNQQTDTLDAKDLVAQEINQEVIPFLNQLKMRII